MALGLTTKAISLDIPDIQNVRLHRNMSFEKYFEGYSRETDGLVHVATYSFHSEAFSTIHRLMPFSRFYISSEKQNAAKKFFKRFPLYVVFTVENLHTKCVYFERSKRLLLGSQNLFRPESDYEELCCEMIVPESDTDKVAALAFSYRSASYLRVQYQLDEIKIYDSPSYVAGKLFLPCHHETLYWGGISDRDAKSADSLSYVYVILQYSLEGDNAYLAFDRLYRYAGEVSEEAFNWIDKQFRPRKQDYVFLGIGRSIDSTLCFKDTFAKFHPIAKENIATVAYYFDNDDQARSDSKVASLKKQGIGDTFFASVKNS